jgi:two-component system OmpR family sensor kinase
VRRPRLPRSFRQQIVVLTASVTAIAMLLLTLVVQLVLAHVTTNDLDRVLEDRADAVVSSVEAGPTGAVTVPASSLDAGVAVYDDHGDLVAGSVPDGLERIYHELSTTDATTLRTAGDQARVQARPFTTSDGASGVVIVAERLEPYEEAERLALIVSLVTGVLATVAAAAIAAWTTRRALRPVAEMAETATEWSEHDLGRRFGLGPPDNEITALAATLDQLLDKVSSAIRSEQRLTSELAHELRTPLTTIQGMADLVLLRDVLPPEANRDVEEISAAGQRMAVTITALLDLARNEATVLAASRSSLLDVLADVTGTIDAGDVALSVDADEARLDLPDVLAVRAISPVVENAVRFATSQVTITSRLRDPGSVEILVDDDGPGLDPSQAEAIFSPGTTSASGTGSGLGLAIARRIARTVGGDVTVETDAPTTRFVIRLPQS